MANEALQKFAEELKSAREEKDMSLQQLSARTKIDLKFLKAIDEGDFDAMPPVYMRAFIKEYASFTGLDPEATIKKYDKARTGAQDFDSVEEENAAGPKPEKKEKEQPVKEYVSPALAAGQDVKPSNGNNLKLIIGAVVLLIIILAVYFGYIKDNSPEFIKEQPYEETLGESGQRFRVNGGEVSDTSAQSAQGESFMVRITASDTSWIGGSKANGERVEFILYPGRSKEIEVNSALTLKIGNSGGISIFSSGRNLNFKGTRGKVRDVRITSKGIEYM